MEQSLLFNIKKRYPHLKKGNRIPATSRYIVDYSKKHYWQNKDFSLALQDYDARDAHLSLVEIKTDIPLILPIRCLRPDLGWFYQLAGSSLLKHPFKNGNGSIVISEILWSRARSAYICFNRRFSSSSSFMRRSSWLSIPEYFFFQL